MKNVLMVVLIAMAFVSCSSTEEQSGVVIDSTAIQTIETQTDSTSVTDSTALDTLAK